MNKKKIISEFRIALKNKTLDIQTFNELCEVLAPEANTPDELITIFNKTTIANLVSLQNAEIFCAMSSYFWDASIDLWELFFEIAKNTKKIKNEDFYNELIRYGDTRVLLLLMDFYSLAIGINGVELGNGWCLTDEKFAKKIANYRGRVQLRAEVISPEVARILAHKKGAIDIPSTFSWRIPKWEDYHQFFCNVADQSNYLYFASPGINQYLANILSRTNGTLRLCGISNLTIGVAKELSKHVCTAIQGCADLEIGSAGTLKCEPGALQEFRNHSGSLILGGTILEITLDDAKALAKNDGYLYITLRKMPDIETVKALLEIKHHLSLSITLDENGSLQPLLTAEMAEALSNYEGESLDFSYSGEIPIESAKILATLGKRLIIGAIFDHWAEEALLESSVKHVRLMCADDYLNYVLDLAKVEQFLQDKAFNKFSLFYYITNEGAELLSTYQGTIDLCSLTHLSDPVALALSRHKGALSFKRLTSISDTALEALSTHQGALSFGSLPILSDEAAVFLAKHEGDLCLNGLTELSEVAAKALSAHKGGYLYLRGLGYITDEAASALSVYQGDLSLSGLITLSASGAKALSSCKGSLYLRGLTELTDDAAEALSKHQGDLYLDGVTKLSDTAAKAMRTKVGTIYEMDPPEWIDTLQSNDGHASLPDITELSKKSFLEWLQHSG